MIDDVNRAVTVEHYDVAIIRYTNRKLYSLSHAGYVNHGDLFDLIRTKKTFAVLDHVTGLNVTDEVLRSMAASVVTSGRLSKAKVLTLIEQFLVEVL